MGDIKLGFLEALESAREVFYYFLNFLSSFFTFQNIGRLLGIIFLFIVILVVYFVGKCIYECIYDLVSTHNKIKDYVKRALRAQDPQKNLEERKEYLKIFKIEILDVEWTDYGAIVTAEFLLVSHLYMYRISKTMKIRKKIKY